MENQFPDKFRVGRSHRVMQIMLKRAESLSEENRELSIYWSVSHMVSSAQTIRLLALLRGLDADFASISAILHDVATFFTGGREGHAAKSLLYIDGIINEYNSTYPKHPVTDGEIKLLKEVIPLHSEKTVDSGDAFAELLKDADALDRYLHGVATKPHEWPRLSRVLEECGAVAGRLGGE